jgi:hypothetical protein
VESTVKREVRVRVIEIHVKITITICMGEETCSVRQYTESYRLGSVAVPARPRSVQEIEEPQ